MERITNKDLDQIVSRLNKQLKRPDSYTPGSFRVDSAYGKTRIVELMHAGGERAVTGYGTKRETHALAWAMIEGAIAAKPQLDEQ